MKRRTGVAAAVIVVAVALCGAAMLRLNRPHNVIIFVADGLRSGIVSAETAPTLAAIRAEGVDFENSHALFPTVTTANASAIATGHGLGDTGDFGNTLFVGEPSLRSAEPSRLAGLEDDRTLGDLNGRFGGDYLNETSLLAAARKAGFQTAVIGKNGPAAIQDVTARDGAASIVIDDQTGSAGAGLPLPADLKRAIKAAGLDLQAPDRSRNSDPGDFQRAGVRRPNDQQQDWFTAVATRVLLPRFKQAGKPFVLVFWSRDPDGTQHNTGDSLDQLIPGINGPTALAGVRNADTDLARLRAALVRLGLDKTTDIVVTADHGFSTISRQSATSAAAKARYADVRLGEAPPGFAAIDLARALNLPLHDPKGLDVDLAHGFHPKSGSAMLGADVRRPELLIGANGGADLIWLRDRGDRALARRVVSALQAQDYVAGVFFDDALGPIAGALPTSAIGLSGTARTPRPSIVVSFRSFATGGCRNAEICAAELAETDLQQGQGIHGSFSRADTHNFMAAIGPDFRQRWRDPAPVSNADIAPTLARILRLDLGNKGPLKGRAALEALKSARTVPAHAVGALRSTPAANGFVTVLAYQTAGGRTYFDWAGMPGRVVKGPGGS